MKHHFTYPTSIGPLRIAETDDSITHISTVPIICQTGRRNFGYKGVKGESGLDEWLTTIREALENGKNAQLRYTLNSGDQVEVMSSNTQTPKQDWLNKGGINYIENDKDERKLFYTKMSEKLCVCLPRHTQLSQP